MDSFQKQSQDSIQHQASTNIPDLSHLVEEVNTSEATPNQPPQQKLNPPKKSKIFFALFILGIFFLLST
ncbi:MAG: hypothetical protein N3A54_06980, partial [Patescibacteria group bacterium]|nr:hypothetical protein [Patescibacteria group bacterium]